jgi:transcriptional regulator with GAF, ATPase, and Fis domain
MPLEVQSKLLRVLQSGEFSRVGGNQTLHSDVRILAATNKRLEEEVENNLFREDLFYRLNVVRIHIPPLRRRVEDVRLLAEYFLQKRSDMGKNRAMQFSKEAVEMLEGYHWPGNVRELENLVQRACVLATGNVLLPGDLPFDQSGGSDNERTVLERSAERFLRAAQISGESPVGLAMRMLVETAQRETGSEAKAAEMLHLSVAEMHKHLGPVPKRK